jgi:hypothetical protein
MFDVINGSPLTRWRSHEGQFSDRHIQLAHDFADYRALRSH